jgi:hypothetical protein
MGIGMRAATASSATLVLMTIVAAIATAQPQQSSELSKSIGLKCPSENGGTLEHSEVDRSGMSYRQQLTFTSGQPAVLARAEARMGQPFRVHATTDLRTETDSGKLLFADIVIRRLLTILERACLGAPDSREQFLAQIRANRASLGLP